MSKTLKTPFRTLIIMTLREEWKVRSDTSVIARWIGAAVARLWYLWNNRWRVRW